MNPRLSQRIEVLKPMTTAPTGAALQGCLTLYLALGLSGCSSGSEPSVGALSPTSSAISSVAPSVAVPIGTTIVPEGGRLPDGTYRVEFTDEHLLAHGLDRESAANNHGVWTTTLRDGRWSIEQVAPDVVDSFAGVYEVRGRDLYWRFHDTLQVLHVRWRTDEAGDLHFTQVSEGPADFQFALPWTRAE